MGRALVWQIALGLLMNAAVLAQQATVKVQEGPHYVGEPVIVRVTAEGFEQEPQPQCRPAPIPTGLSLRLVGVHPSVSNFTQVINGRVKRYRRVVYAFDFHALANKPGTYRVGPFTVQQAGRQVRTEAFDLSMRQIQTDGDMRVALVLPSTTVYPGQRVPVVVEWWYAGELNEVRNLSIRSPLFDQFTFIDQAVSQNDTALPIWTEKGPIQIKARAQQKTVDGRSFTVLSAQRQLMVEKPGTIQLAPITATVEKVTRWRRGVFGRRQPVATAKIRAVGKPQTLQIKPLPLDQAPPSFAGAVGHGFTIAVKADRTVLHAGDPIVLQVTVRGDGHLEQAGPPRLSAQGGLDPQQFRSPTDDVAGTVTDDGKQFSMTVRVIDESVSELGPIAYSWFDPKRERFLTTTSQPIALNVLPAQMVTAQDVVSAQEPPEAVEQAGAAPSGQRAEATGISGKRFDLTGADLAIERDANRLLIQDAQRFGGVSTHAAIYLGSCGLILFAWWRRTAAQADPALRQRRKTMKQEMQRIGRAAKLPRQEAASQIAVALRQLAPRACGEARGQIDRLLAECDAVAYAPADTGSEPLDRSFHRQVSAVAQSVVKEMS